MASRFAIQPNASLFWHLDANPRGNMCATSHFMLTVRWHPFSWIPARRCRLLKAARFQNLRNIIINASVARLDEEISSGTAREDESQRRLTIDTVLVLSEASCITIAAAACIASLTMHESQDSRLVVSSAEQPFVPRKANLPIWQSFFLLGALIINAILRARQKQGRGHSRNSVVVSNSSVEERLQKLEEDTASVVTIVRVLSKQLEKLAVRFRVTRQTLRDPIQETAVLTQKTSESVNILAAREDALEKSLEEIYHVLLGMQGNQTKQLEVISTLGKLIKDRPSDKLEKWIKRGKTDQAGTQQGGRVRIKNVDGAPQKKITEKLGSLAATAKLVSQTMSDDGSSNTALAQVRTQSEEPSKPTDNPLKVDYWLSNQASVSVQKAEEPIPVARARDYLPNDGRNRSAFVDSTTDCSFHHSDAKD